MSHSRIAVGDSHLVASRIFGPENTQIFLTTYSDFAAEADWGSLEVLQLAPGHGLPALLSAAVDRLEGGAGFQVSVDYRAGAAALRETLSARSGVGVAAIRSRGTTLLVDLAPLPEGEPPPGETTFEALDLLLETMDAAAAPQLVPELEPGFGAPPQHWAPSPPPEESRTVRAVDRVLEIMNASRLRNRTIYALVIGFFAALSVGAVMAVLIDWERGKDASIVILLLASVAGQGLLGLLLIGVLRDQHRISRSQQRLGRRTRGLVDKRTARLIKQNQRLQRDLAALGPVTEYVLEVGRLLAEDTVRMEAALAELRRERTDAG